MTTYYEVLAAWLERLAKLEREESLPLPLGHEAALQADVLRQCITELEAVEEWGEPPASLRAYFAQKNAAAAGTGAAK